MTGMYNLSYDKDLKRFSRDLRNHSTYGEVLLWMELRAGQMKGYKFNRQKPLDKYILDFYCKRLNLVIEIDGDTHHSEKARLKDEKRQLVLENLGLNFLRFDDSDVQNKMEMVLERIMKFIEEFESANLSLQKQIPLAPFSKGEG
jgi:very-short-patch-repair endonuclease